MTSVATLIAELESMKKSVTILNFGSSKYDEILVELWSLICRLRSKDPTQRIHADRPTRLGRHVTGGSTPWAKFIYKGVLVRDILGILHL